MKINNQKGFTLIELVLVITILGILAVAALPSFIDITSQATTASRDGVVGAIREGLAIQYSYDLVINPTSAAYPTTLGGTDGAASDSNQLFSNVLDQGVNNDMWEQAGLVYTFDDNGSSETCYTYTPASGSFLQSTCP